MKRFRTLATLSVAVIALYGSTAPGALLRHLDALLLYAEDEAWLPGVTP